MVYVQLFRALCSLPLCLSEHNSSNGFLFADLLLAEFRLHDSEMRVVLKQHKT